MIYVDRLFSHPGAPRLFRQSCHLIADTEAELHDFAVDRLKMKREWFQPKPFPHYDLTPNRRIAAVKYGAVEVTNRELVRHMRRIREANP